MPTYTLTITEADLDAAIAARASRSSGCFERCYQCILAQAVARQEGQSLSFGYGFRRGLTYYTAQRTPARDLISLFDADEPEQDAILRAKLPMTVELLATED